MAQTAPKSDLILPGASVAEVELDGSPMSFQTVFSRCPGRAGAQIGRSGGTACPDAIYYWSDLARDPGVVTAYLNDGVISQISTQGPVFSLPNGLRTGATEEQVKRAYPKGQGYVLSGSAGHLNGGRNLVCWADEGAGVAFKFTWWPSKKESTLSGIDIFPKGSDFRPEGCISPPQQWEKLKQPFPADAHTDRLQAVCGASVGRFRPACSTGNGCRRGGLRCGGSIRGRPRPPICTG